MLLALFSGLLAEEKVVRAVGSDLLGEGVAGILAQRTHETGVRMALALAGTRPALAELHSGTAELGIVLLPPEETPPSGDCVSIVLAHQAVAFVVPESSPARELTLEQMRGLLTPAEGGGFATWGDLGFSDSWRDRPLAVHALSAEVALAVPLVRRMLGSETGLKPSVQYTTGRVDLHRRVAAETNGVGLTVGVPDPGSGLRVLALAASRTGPAYLPTADTLAGGLYPLRLSLYLCARRSAVPRLLPLLRALLRDETASALRAAGFVPVPLARREELLIGLEGDR